MSELSFNLNQQLKKSNVNPISKLEVLNNLNDTTSELVLNNVSQLSITNNNSTGVFTTSSINFVLDNSSSRYSTIDFSNKFIRIYLGYIINNQEQFWLQGIYKIYRKRQNISKQNGNFITLEGRDLLSSTFSDTEFKDSIDFSQTITDTDISITSSTSTSELTSGEDIQAQSIVSFSAIATVLGGDKNVINQNTQSNLNNLKDNSTITFYNFEYEEQGLTQLELTFILDLQQNENISAINLTKDSNSILDGSIEYSLDGVTWANFTTTISLRYIRFKLINTNVVNNKITITINEVQVTTTSNFNKENAYDGNLTTSWRPDANDVDREIVLSFTSTTINTVYIDFGLSEQDRYNAIKYKIESSNNNGISYMSIYEESEFVYGLVEVTFSNIISTNIRITITSELSGISAIRDIKEKNISLTYSYSDIIKNILTSENFTDLSLIRDTKYYPQDNYAIQIGDSKYKILQELADAINWKFYINNNGIPVLSPIYYPILDSDYTYRIKHISNTDSDFNYDNVYSFGLQDEYNTRNYVIGISSTPDNTFSATYINDNPLELLSIQNVGEKVKVFNFNVNSQEETDKFTLNEFINISQFKRQVTLLVQGNPALNILDLISVNYLQENIDNIFQIYSYTHRISRESGYTTSLVLYQL